jgi:hypothetical protein
MIECAKDQPDLDGGVVIALVVGDVPVGIVGVGRCRACGRERTGWDCWGGSLSRFWSKTYLTSKMSSTRRRSQP